MSGASHARSALPDQIYIGNPESTMSGAATTSSDKAATSSRRRNLAAALVNPTESIYGATPGRTFPSSDKRPSDGHGNRLGTIARLFSSSHRILGRHSVSSASDGQTVNEAARRSLRWRKTHSVLYPQTRDYQLFTAKQRSPLAAAQEQHHSRTSSRTAVYDVVDGERPKSHQVHNKSRAPTAGKASAVGISTTSGTALNGSVSAADATSRTATGTSRQRKTAVYSRDFPVEGVVVGGSGGSRCSETQFPSVEHLIKMYANMLAERKNEFEGQKQRAKSEGEFQRNGYHDQSD